MKLLFDQNLSHKLTRCLADHFPDSTHVREVGLKEAEDPLVWEYAKQARVHDCVEGCRFSPTELRLGISSKGGLDQTWELHDCGS
jgi:hypothetical protein